MEFWYILSDVFRRISVGSKMQQRCSVCLLLLSLSGVVNGQSKTVPSQQTTRTPKAVGPGSKPTLQSSEPKSGAGSANPSSRVKTPATKYLTIPFDLEQTNVGQDFVGHGITSVAEAIK